ncbi:hypothetical protein [Flavobacterium salmonis]|uniref:Uncharacterized protein n=1 Tax=Flavobacterium salmonis TaxID=2654844 RepID=A0A6V6YS38_9FLAO|nr:hypothetical protein [Flavobacterium salmonis]CAD0002307.1 hypothetical protein FLAT13_01043 [Flavobacterium salmonis]
MIIEGLNIFITWDQYKILLNDNVREKLDNLQPIDPDNVKKVFKEKNKILFDAIETRYRNKENALEFLNSWMKFDIEGKEAKENAWNLLNDYCREKDYTYLKDNRSFDEQLRADCLGNSYTYYPLSKKFSLIYHIPERKNWFGKIIQFSSEIEILIDTDKITRIEGEFKFIFKIHTLEYEYIFGRGLSIIPNNK